MKTSKLPCTRNLLLLAAAILLAGCATHPLIQRVPPKPKQPATSPGKVTPLPPGQRPQVTQQQQSKQENRRPSRPAPARKPGDISSPAVMALLNTSDKLASAGHMDRAAAVLQRALNIEPRNPFVYQRLAAVRLAQGQIDQAKTLAQKSNSLAVGNPYIQADNWVLIAQARRMAGNTVGQKKAKAMVQKLRLRSAALQ